MFLLGMEVQTLVKDRGPPRAHLCKVKITLQKTQFAGKMN